MKAVQFIKSNSLLTSGNDVEVFAILGGSITYSGSGRGEDFVIQKTYERDNKCYPLQFEDWIVDIDGVILVLTDEQYQALLTVVNPQKSLGDLIGDAVRKVIKEERRKGGLVARDQSKQVKVDKDGLVTSMYPLTHSSEIKRGNPNEQP